MQKEINKKAMFGSNKLLHRIWDVNKNENSTLNGFTSIGWNQSPFGKCHLSLFPSSILHTSAGDIRPICHSFEDLLLGLNYETKCHLDDKDRWNMTHCVSSPPTKKGIKQKFQIGNCMIDISSCGVGWSFPAGKVCHSSSMVQNAPKLPHFMTGNKMMEKFDKAENIKEWNAFIQTSMISWGGWAWWSKEANRQQEWLSAAQDSNGNTLPKNQQTLNRIALQKYWTSQGFVKPHSRKVRQNNPGKRQAISARKTYRKRK